MMAMDHLPIQAIKYGNQHQEELTQSPYNGSFANIKVPSEEIMP